MILDKIKNIFTKKEDNKQQEEEQKVDKLQEIINSYDGNDMKISIRKFAKDYSTNAELNDGADISFNTGSLVQITYSSKANLFLFRAAMDTSDTWYKMPLTDYEVINW